MSIDQLTGGNIEPRGLEEEMRSSYLDYAMSVIVGRALPDVRDGLKPVHRRVLFSMSENGMGPTRPYSKCARIVGDVMGTYHPHGDSAIYDALVRLAQDFSMRYPVVGATVAFIDNPEIALDGLTKHIKGPDFPTGGVILGRAGIRDAYETGRGRVRVRARAHIEPLSHGKEAIVVTELPYMVKKGGDGGLIQKIADLVHDKKIPEISDLRDESDRNGMRLVIELKRDVLPKVVLNKLYKHTPMQSTFGVNMVALVDGVPKTLSLREVIHHYVDHQREVVVRRAKYELGELERRVHVLEGLLIALENLDEVIALIRAARDRETARTQLVERFALTTVQAEAILQLRLSQLTALESDAIKTEHAEKTERIGELREL